jgi:hypothetical protein
MISSAIAYTIESVGDLAMILWRWPRTVWLVMACLICLVLCFVCAKIAWEVACSRFDIPRTKRLLATLSRERLRNHRAELELAAQVAFYRDASMANVLRLLFEEKRKATESVLAHGPRAVV